LFTETDVAIGEVSLVHQRSSLAETGLAQMRAIEGAIDCDFALLAAALRTNFTAHAGTVPARAPLFAQFAGDIHQSCIA